MFPIANYEICFACRKLFSKQKLYKNWDSYYDGLFPADEENTEMYKMSLMIQRSSLWKCTNCRPLICSHLIGKKLERIDENSALI